MTNLWKIFGIGLGFVFLAFILATQMISSGQDNLSQDNLNNAVRSALVSSRDNSARTSPGTFVVNKQKFTQNLGNTALKRFAGKKVDFNRAVKVDYLQDKDTDIPATADSNYEPIKAVSVKVNLNPNLKKATNDKQNTHTITDVIQTPHDSNNSGGGSDQPNDLTN